MITNIDFTEEEYNSGNIGEDTLRKAFDAYMEDGCIQLNNVFQEGYINNLNSSFIKKYSRFLKGNNYKDALQVGDKRVMVTVKMEPPFSSSKLYANPLVYPLIKALLGNECIINSFGGVVSLPGALDQDPHYDHPSLFRDDDIDLQIPSYAITMIVPLVELNEKTGMTALMKGSHRKPININADYGLSYEYGNVPLGSCVLMDYKLRHYGVANRSGSVRPILYNIYSRPWFRDYKNFVNQPELLINQKEFMKIPDEFKHLFLTSTMT